MRIFAGLTPSPELKDRIGAVILDLKKKYPNAAWERSEKIHLTVFFMGSANFERVKEVRQSLAELAERSQPFNLKIENLSYFYKKGEDSIIYLDVKDPSGEGSELYKNFYRILLSKKFSPSRRISLHLTIGRVKRQREPHEVKQTLLEILKEGINIAEDFPVQSIELYESLYSHDQDSSNYKLIESFRLVEKRSPGQ